MSIEVWERPELAVVAAWLDISADTFMGVDGAEQRHDDLLRTIGWVDGDGRDLLETYYDHLEPLIGHEEAVRVMDVIDGAVAMLTSIEFSESASKSEA